VTFINCSRAPAWKRGADSGDVAQAYNRPCWGRQGGFGVFPFGGHAEGHAEIFRICGFFREAVGETESRLDGDRFQFYDFGKDMKKFSPGLAGVLTLLFLATRPVGAAESARSPTIVLISGEYEYKSAETLPVFKRYLETNYAFHCVYLERTQGEEIPGLDALDTADLVILFIRRMTLPEEQLGRIRNYVNSGRPLIGLRTASHAFENWKEWDPDVLGGNYHMHYDDKLVATIKTVSEASEDPILKGVGKEFIAGGSLYRNAPLPPSSTVLLTGSVTNQPPEPVAWTHRYKGARVFYTSLGHPKDFENPSFRRLVVNAIFWALNRPAHDASVYKQKPEGGKRLKGINLQPSRHFAPDVRHVPLTRAR